MNPLLLCDMYAPHEYAPHAYFKRFKNYHKNYGFALKGLKGLKLELFADSTHNFKWVKITYIRLIWDLIFANFNV